MTSWCGWRDGASSTTETIPRSGRSPAEPPGSQRHGPDPRRAAEQVGHRVAQLRRAPGKLLQKLQHHPVGCGCHKRGCIPPPDRPPPAALGRRHRPHTSCCGHPGVGAHFGGRTRPSRVARPGVAPAVGYPGVSPSVCPHASPTRGVRASVGPRPSRVAGAGARSSPGPIPSANLSPASGPRPAAGRPTARRPAPGRPAPRRHRQRHGQQQPQHRVRGKVREAVRVTHPVRGRRVRVEGNDQQQQRVEQQRPAPGGTQLRRGVLHS